MLVSPSRSSSVVVIIALFLGLWLTACGGASEVARVTDRPDRDTTARTAEQRPVAPPIEKPAGYEQVEAERFDDGKMWTFSDPPLEYFNETYDMTADEAWLDQARLGALRFSDSCSASLVSDRGLAMTNHHCARDFITKVSRSDEQLLEEGFYAAERADERPVEGLYVEQVVGIEDVTSSVRGVLSESGDDQARAQARRNRVQEIEDERTRRVEARDTTLRVEVARMYSGARYTAITYRRLSDVRLVMAPELQLGYFGGDTDNFTYPRFNLDMAFFRVYEDGRPLQNEAFFSWNTSGSQAGDPVFVVGNPGSTSRQKTVEQLKFMRNFTLPQQLNALQRRSDVLEAYLEGRTAAEDTTNVRNITFSVRNTLKSLNGQLEGLQDDALMARRTDREQTLREAVNTTGNLRQSYGNAFVRMTDTQRARRSTAGRDAAFVFFGSNILDSRVITRGLYGYYYHTLRRQGIPPEEIADLRESAMDVSDWPDEVEEAFLAIRLDELREAFGPNHPTVRRVLADTTPEDLAASIVERTALTDSTQFVEIFDEGYLDSGDASVSMMQAVGPLFIRHIQSSQSLTDREDNLLAQINRVRLATLGRDTVPPDANFTLRIADGVVQGYANDAGEDVPPYTTFAGMYARYDEHGPDSDWALPGRWLDARGQLDQQAPLNLVSTNDITGGNSGSPLLNRDLEVVGLIFDSNLEALPNAFIYRDEQARAVSVDVRAIREALVTVYGADRLVRELTGKAVVRTGSSE
jgi:hypothetical protein